MEANAVTTAGIVWVAFLLPRELCMESAQITEQLSVFKACLHSYSMHFAVEFFLNSLAGGNNFSSLQKSR